MQQKVLNLEGNVAQLTAQVSTGRPAQLANQDTAQLKALEADIEQRHQQELSSLKEKNREQELKIDHHDAIVQQLIRNQTAEPSLKEEDLLQQHQQTSSTVEDKRQAQMSELKAEHASLVEQLTRDKEELKAQLKEAQAAAQIATDDHEKKVELLTEQTEKLRADLSTVKSADQSISDQHEPVIKMLREQKKDLQADLKEVQSAHGVLEEKLISANLQVVEAEEKLEDVEQRLRQAEQRNRKTAKTVRVCPLPPLSPSGQGSLYDSLHAASLRIHPPPLH